MYSAQDETATYHTIEAIGWLIRNPAKSPAYVLEMGKPKLDMPG